MPPLLTFVARLSDGLPLVANTAPDVMSSSVTQEHKDQAKDILRGLGGTATSNSGIILLSPDGLEIIEQHTTQNSPLISDNILDLQLDHSTGELFIVTDEGLISYRTNATYEDPEYSSVTVFPNPARPEFQGPITIQGIRYNSDVKITDIAGNLVYKTTSNGGTATWDGKTLNGDRVQTGVYLIWTAANDGQGRKVGKVLVIH